MDFELSLNQVQGQKVLTVLQDIPVQLRQKGIFLK